MKGRSILSSAGHPPALFKPAGETRWSFVAPNEDRQDAKPQAGLPLAVAPDTVYASRVLPAASGDRLFIYTDGVTETRDPAGELFGDDRLRRVLDGGAGASLAQLKSAVLEALREHAGDGPPQDDVTIIAMEVR